MIHVTDMLIGGRYRLPRGAEFWSDPVIVDWWGETTDGDVWVRVKDGPDVWLPPIVAARGVIEVMN